MDKIKYLELVIRDLQEDINFLVDKLEEDYDTNYSDMKKDPSELLKDIEKEFKGL